MAEIDPGSVELVVVLSPHGRRTGVYGLAAGDLGPFGHPDVGVEINADVERAERLARAWGVDLLDEDVDYGIIVPFILWEPKAEPARVPAIVTAAIGEGSDAGAAGRAFADALMASTTQERVLFVASANGSTGLSARAPLTELDGARALQDVFVAALQSGSPALEDGARELAESAGSCGLGPLTAFARLCGGRTATVLVHEEPVGVGYTVALTDD